MLSTFHRFKRPVQKSVSLQSWFFAVTAARAPGQQFLLQWLPYFTGARLPSYVVLGDDVIDCEFAVGSKNVAWPRSEHPLQVLAGQHCLDWRLRQCLSQPTMPRTHGWLAGWLDRDCTSSPNTATWPPCTYLPFWTFAVALAVAPAVGVALLR